MVTESVFNFSYERLSAQLQLAQAQGYRFQTLLEWYRNVESKNINQKVFCLRVDIDFFPEKLIPIISILTDLEIKATFFVRLHSTSYNPVSFANLNLISYLKEMGHEIGLHHESVDFATMVGGNPASALRYELRIFEAIFGIAPAGVAGHGGLTGLNNQDVFKETPVNQFDIVYEGYDAQDGGIFSNSRYVSDSLWTKWKAYDCGKLMEGDHRTLEDHILENPRLLYVLIHPDTFYNEYPYENFR
jgi:hypothetical protein